MVRAADLHGVAAVVRVPVNQPHVILRFLDTGALGCQVPWVQTAEDAERVVQAVKYQPRGARGLAGVRAADYGERGSLGDYVRAANEETLVVVQVESASAVGQIDAIAAVEGVDVIFLGPTGPLELARTPGRTAPPDRGRASGARGRGRPRRGQGPGRHGAGCREREGLDGARSALRHHGGRPDAPRRHERIPRPYPRLSLASTTAGGCRDRC